MSIAPQNILPNQSNVDTNNNKNLNSKYLLKSVVESPNPNDDSIIDLNYEKKLTTIDYDKMKHTVKSTHATNLNGEYYTCKEACWSFNPGNHRCVGSSEKSDMTKFGVGITLYFKFVKRLILFFFLFTLLSIPAYVFYTSSFATYTKAQDSLSYIDLLTATTVGSVGLGSTSCAVRKLKTGTDKQRLLQFQCPGGKIADVNNIVYGLVKQGTTCTFVDTSELVVSCNTYDMNALRTALKDCIGAKDCKITVPTDIFKTGDSNCDQLYNTMNVYMKVACEVKTIKLGKTSQLVVQKSTVAYVVAALDAVIIVIFLVMLYTLKFAQKNAVTNIQKRTYSASSYTVEFLNLPQNMAVEELSAKLWVFLDQKLGEKSVEAGHRVVDVQIVLPNKLIEYNKKVGMLIHKKNELTRYFIETYVPDYAKKQIDYDGLKAIMQEIIERNHPKAKEAEKVFSHIRKLAFKKMKTLNEIQKLKTVKEVKIVSAFVTFSSIPARDKILDSFINSPLERLMRMMCTRFFDKNVSFYGKILRARTSSDPGSILWENLGEPGPKVFARRAVSAVLTLILWAFSGTILIISTYYKNDFRKNFPTIDCSDQTVTAGQAGDDYLLGEYQSGLLECYCQQDLVNNLYHQFSRVDNQTLCLTWFTNRVIETSITLAIVFVVLIVNYFVQFVFQALSKFEKHSTFNKQITTRVFKTFVAQFLNTGLMILIVNIKFDISFWQGQFRDISPLWYQNVGSTLLSTMFINILTIPSVRISFVLLQKIKRFCDRRCKSDERITRKKTQEAYEKLYSGPEFIIDFRYSQMLTLTFVCFLYSGGMPLLYFSSFLQLVITYFFDKVYLLKVNKLPRNYDQSLEAAVRPAMYIALVIHLVFAIFMFGNNEIFSQSVVDFVSLSASVTSITENISNDDANVVTKFFKRTVLNFNVVLTILLLVIIALFLVKDVLIGVLRKTFLTFFTTDEEKTQKNGKKVNPIMLANSTFFHALQTEDLAKLIKLTKITLKTTQNQELAQQLQSKLVLLRQEYLTKKQEIQQPMNFIGFYSYDVRLQDRYAAQFGIEEMLERETLD